MTLLDPASKCEWPVPTIVPLVSSSIASASPPALQSSAPVPIPASATAQTADTSGATQPAIARSRTDDSRDAAPRAPTAACTALAAAVSTGAAGGEAPGETRVSAAVESAKNPRRARIVTPGVFTRTAAEHDIPGVHVSRHHRDQIARTDEAGEGALQRRADFDRCGAIDLRRVKEQHHHAGARRFHRLGRIADG